MVKDLSTNTEDIGDRIPSLGQEDPLEEEMATHSSILARILEYSSIVFQKSPWTKEPGGIYSPQSHKESDTT